MKKAIVTLWPVIVIILLWFVFASPYFIKGKVPFPSSYLVSFFPPWNATYGMPVKNNAMPDTISQIYPWKKLTIDTWKSGKIPLWNPYSFSGTPHAANYQTAVFSPINALFLLFPFLDAWSLQILLQPLFAGLGMYLFLRSIHKHPVSATVGAIAFMFSGFMTTWMAYGTLGYAALFLPWLFFAVSSANKKSSSWSYIVISICTAWSFLSGHFQISVYVLGATVLYVLFEAIKNGSYQQGAKQMIFILIGVGIAMPQLLLTRDAYTASVRSSSFIQAEVIPWNYIVTVFSPDYYGNPVTRNDWFGHYAEWASYIGVIPLILALYALCLFKDRRRRFFILAAAGAMLLAYNTPLNDFLFWLKLPAISTSAASRIIVLFSFSMAVLSAFGFEDIVVDRSARSWKKMAWFSVIIAVVLSVFWIVTYFGILVSGEKALIAQRNSLLPTLLSLSGLGIAWVSFIKKRWIGRICAAIIIVLVSFDVYRFAFKWMPFDPREFVYPPVKSLEYLKRQTGKIRVFGNIGNESGGTVGLLLIEGYDAMYQGRYAEFINAASKGLVTQGERSVVAFDKHGLYRSEALQLLGVRYIYHRKSDGRNVWTFPYWQYAEIGQMKQVYADDDYWIYEYTDTYPRVFLASEYVVKKSDDEIISTLFSPDFDRRNTVLLEEKPSMEPAPGPGDAEIISYTANAVTIKTNSQVPKILYLSDVYDKGWSARVDGRSTSVYRANYDFRAVGVPPGEHVVEFSYLPRSFIYGAYIAGLSVLCLVGISMKKRV